MIKYFFVITIILTFSQFCFASTGELYGYGSKASSLGNSMMGGVSGGYGTFYNPAANSALPGLHISLGVGFAHPKFTDIRGVTVANNATTAQTSDVTGNIDTDSYLDHLGQVLGASFNLGEKFKNLTLGATAFMPIARVAYLDTGEAFKPEYFNYRSRTQRPQIYGSMSAMPFHHLHLATGLAIATNLSGSATVFATGSNNSVSYMRFASTIKPSVAPYFSIYADPKPLQAGATVRLPNKSSVSLDTTANARLLGPTNDLPLVVNSSSTLFYDPLEVDVALAYDISDRDWITTEVDWLQYKAFEEPTLTVTDLGSAFKLQNSISSRPSMRNIFVPKIGYEHRFEYFAVRVGYLFRPSPIKDNSGPGNLIDPTKHVATLGFGLDLKKVQVTEKEISLDLHAQYHHLVRQHVDKSPGNELGIAGQSKVGAPGYDMGGDIYGAGLSVSMNF